MDKRTNHLKIVVADSSAIIRGGMSAILRRLSNINVHPVEISDIESLQNYTERYHPDMVIVNPTFCGWFGPVSFKDQFTRENIKVVALMSNMVDPVTLKSYDEKISIYDEVNDINDKLENLLGTEKATSNLFESKDDKEVDAEALSQREKEIIACVVKGMTNKSIADMLYISIHTVITHRRNIARKLQIHSPAGLTIYAIVNKLVDIKDIKEGL